MSAPVMPAAPAARTASTGGTSDAGGADSGTPFASALDGALAEGRGTVGDGATGDGESQDSESPAGPVVPGEAGAVEVPAAVVLPATLWALALGSAQAGGQPATPPAGDAALAVSALAPGEATGTSAVAPGAAASTAVPAAAPAGAAAPPVAGLPVDPAVVPATGGPAAPGLPAAAPGSVPAAGGPAPADATAAASGTTTTPPASAPDPAADATSAQAAPAVLPGTANPSAGAGTGGQGQSQSQGQGSGGAAPGVEAAEPVTTPVPGAALPTLTPAAPDADGATGAAASLPVAGQVARQVAVLRGGPDGSHTMTLVLTPETLGPVEVSVTVTKGTVDLMLRGAHEQGRAALLDALPDLRRDLEAAGLTTSKLEVARDSGGSWLDRHAAGQQAQQGFGDRPGQQGPPDGRSRPWLRPADSGETRTVPTTGSPSSGVDVRV